MAIWHGYEIQRVRLNKTQQAVLEQLVELRHETYNEALKWRTRKLGDSEALATICLLRNRRNPVVTTHPELARQIVVNCLAFNLRGFTRNQNNQQTKSLAPKPKTEKSKRSFELKQGVSLGEGSITISGLGKFRSCKRDFNFTIPRGSRYLSTTISENGGYWYVGISFTTPGLTITERPLGNPVGIDVNLRTNLAVTFDGVEHRTYLHADITEMQQRFWDTSSILNRKLVGSGEWKLAKKQNDKAKRHLDEVRDRHQQSIVNDILRTDLPTSERPRAIVIETLDIAEMMKADDWTYSAGYARATLGRFRLLLTHGAENQGTKIIYADKWYPSTKTCSCCGAKKPMPPGLHTYECPKCGVVLDRDENSASNLWGLANEVITEAQAS